MGKATRAYSGRTPMTCSRSPAHKTRWIPPDGLRSLCCAAPQKDAFAGKLIPQDPAAELLAHICAAGPCRVGEARRAHLGGAFCVNYSSPIMNLSALPVEHAPALADALFTTTQQRLLALLYGEPARSFYLKELLRKTGLGVATVKRALDRMVEVGLLTRTVIGNQHHYQANPVCPIHDELVAIVRKTLSASGAIREALNPLADRIARAFVFGSFAAGKDRPGSDIDLLVIGDVPLAELAALSRAEGAGA